MIYQYQPTKYYHTYGPNPVALHVNSGDTIITSTVDAGGFDHNGEQIPEEFRQKNPDTVYNNSNPLTGPFSVIGACPGDTISVEIKRISLTRETAWSANASNFGGLTEEAPGKLLLFNDPIPRKRYEWSLDLKNQTASTILPSSKFSNPVIPLHPFIGSIGVAPRFGRVEMSLTPGEFGGNMDFPEICTGAILYLPVNWRGGLLVLGDIHAAQGDGELCGIALETSAEVEIKVDVIKSTIEWPRLVNNEWIMTIGSSRPLMEAYKIAHLELVKWLINDYGYDKWDALQLTSQVGRCKIANVVDPNYTVVAKFPRKYLM
jgi:acetamidase/formamidase